MRYRWDLYWAAGLNPYLVNFDYKLDHLDTALRAIVKPL